MQLIITILSFLLAPVAVTACEGKCIVGTTNAFLRHCTSPMLTTFQNMASASPFNPFLLLPHLTSNDTLRRTRSICN